MAKPSMLLDRVMAGLGAGTWRHFERRLLALGFRL